MKPESVRSSRARIISGSRVRFSSLSFTSTTRSPGGREVLAVRVGELVRGDGRGVGRHCGGRLAKKAGPWKAANPRRRRNVSASSAVVSRESVSQPLSHQPNPRCLVGVPRISLVAGGDDFRGELSAAVAKRGDIEVEVVGGEGGEVFCAELEEAGGGAEAGGVFGVAGVEVVLLQVDEGAGDLDEAFVEEGVAVVAAEPEVFEDIVGLVVLGGVEAGEVARVVRIERGCGRSGEGADEGGDAVAFFHRAAGGAKTILRGVVCDKKRLVLEASAAGAL